MNKRRAFLRGLMMALLAGLAGCKVPRTEVVVGILTDIASKSPLARVRLTVSRNMVPALDTAQDPTPSPAVLRHLGTFGIYTLERREPPFQIDLIGLKMADDNSPELLRQTRILSFVDERTLYLSMSLLQSCIGVKCATNETCDDGRCVPQAVDPATLPDFVEGADMAAPPPPERPDLAIPDLAMPDLAKPDLAMPDLHSGPIADAGGGGVRDAGMNPDLTLPPGPRVPAQCLNVTTENATREARWGQGVDVDLDVRIIGKMIVGYQIQWNNGSWSQVYTPGVDDIDWVTNNGAPRRVWSYFYDHTHRYYTGVDVQATATKDPRWTQGTSLALDNQIIGKDITSYRIQDLNGIWSRNYTPGVDDIDWMTNIDGSQRRVWSYFADHTHRYATCPP